MTEQALRLSFVNRSKYIFPESHWIYGLERNQRIWKLLRAVSAPFVNRILQFSCRQFRVRSKKCLVLANHATEYDFLMLAAMFPKYLRFVAPDRMLRRQVMGPLLSWFANPIPRRVSDTDPIAEKYIKTNLRLGINVAMFAEQGRSMNGRTGPLMPDLARIIKESEGGLVTVKLTRGYLVSPQWGSKKRRGPTTGRVVREYTREELDAMSISELNDVIREDLGYDVWEDQESRRLSYKCSAPAEGLENALFVCPSCKRIGTLVGHRSDVLCSCGFSQTMDKYGFFSNRDAEFRTVLEWDLWQRNYLAANASAWEDNLQESLCIDEGIRLSSVDDGVAKPMLDGATMTLYPDRILFSAGEPLFSFSIRDVENMVSYHSRSLLFTWRGREYEVSKNSTWPTMRFVAIWRLLREQ